MGNSAEKLGLYVSVPFCRAKCSFCNFASGVSGAEAVERYLPLLCAEIRGARAWAARHGAVLPERVDTVYFGGGTPSLLTPEQLRRVFAAIRESFNVEPGAEITLEAAPGQIADEVLAAALDQGLNRVSLGVQSFVDRESMAVGRTHTQAGCLAEFTRLRSAGVRNLGADLIVGLPYQTDTSWEETLRVAGETELEHLSVYLLEIDDESRLGREVLGGGARLHAPAVASEESMAALYERACATLPKAGFLQYEISNFARPGWQSQHNRKYWERAPYFGFGLDAHSMLHHEDGRAMRWGNPETLDAYRGTDSTPEPALVTEREAFEETVFLRLRLREGMAWRALEAFPVTWVHELREALPLLQEGGLVENDRERLWLTERGRLVSGAVFGELLAGATV